jgi:tetratricopeptide (TPR) repeat protein
MHPAECGSYEFGPEYATAEKLYREAITLASEFSDAFKTLKSHYFLTLTLANLGRISEALEVLSRATENDSPQRQLLLGHKGSELPRMDTRRIAGLRRRACSRPEWSGDGAKRGRGRGGGEFG